MRVTYNFVIPGQNYSVDYHMQMTPIATFDTGILNTGMQRNADIQ